jgi:hypothetical protein
MTKRNVAAVLWFAAGWSGGGLLAGLIGLPTVLGLIPGIALAILVRWDPTGAIWSRSVTGKRIVRPINEFADSLSKDAPSGVAAKGRARF